MLLITWIAFLSLFQISFAQTSTDLILGLDASQISKTIQIHQDANNIVFQLGSKIPTGQTIVFGPHVPYPISSFTFVLPGEKCNDWLHCDSDGLIPMEETHISGQVVKRSAAIRFSVVGTSWRKRVNIIVENEIGERAEINEDLNVIQ